MLFNTHFFIFLSFFGIFFAAIAEENFLVTKLKIHQPNWRLDKVSYFPDGALKKCIYYAPVAGSKDEPVKEILYSKTGEKIQETDLIDDHGKILYHGPSVRYDLKGNIATIHFYYFGILHGPVKEIYPNGVVKKNYAFDKGIKEGPMTSYYEDGKLMKSGFYLHNKLSGEFISYHPNGIRESLSTYEKGFLQGEVTRWFENGNIAAKEFYASGLLHGQSREPALRHYYEDNTLKESQNFTYGIPCGSHIRYHRNGKESYKVNFAKGKKVGIERFLKDDGTLVGEGEYVDGISINTHYRKNPLSQLIFLASYDLSGKLTSPILEFYDSGQKKLEYVKDHLGYQGPFFELYENGNLKRKYTYKNDCLDGLQEEFFENGKLQLKCHYANRKKEGFFEEWFESGQKAKEVNYKNGLKVGVMTAFYSNGEKMSEAHFDEQGKLHGPNRYFEENGQLVFQATFKNGLKSGLMQEWYKNGNVKRICHYKEGKKHGKEEFFHENKIQALKANYIDGLLDGSYISFFENGKIFEEKQFVLGTPVGMHIENHLTEIGEETQLAKEARYKDGLLDGTQTRFFKSGIQQAVLNYKSNTLHGLKALWNKDGELIEEATYDHGGLTGRFFLVKDNGKEFIYHYKDNLLDGVHQIYFAPHPLFGKVKAFEAYYENGVIQGMTSEYNEAGMLLVATHYKDGLKHGPATFYDHDGKVKAIAEFKHDNQNGWTFEYFKDGQIKREVFFVDDLKTGEEKTYFKNGVLACLKSFKNGLLCGFWQEWDKSGTLIFNAEYLDGKPNGLLSKYKSDGTPYLLHRYEDGHLVEKFEP